MINGKGYYHFKHCENILDLCARCCFSIKVGNDRRCDGPFPCEPKSYYVRPEDCPVKIANATINMDLPEPPEPGEAGKEQEENAAAQQQLTERNEEETFKADKVKRAGNIGKKSYYGFPNGVEAEDICRYLSFNLGNVVKYACRAGRKDVKKKIEDLRKAKDYLEDEIRRTEEEKMEP